MKVSVVRSPAGFLVAVTFIASAALSCEEVDNSGAVETKVGALTGPIQSISQTQGVAPVNITQTTSPDGFSSTSFTIGLFTEDAVRCGYPNRTITPAKCAIDLDLNPIFHEDVEAYNNTPALPTFDDTSVVQATINVGTSKKLHWDWTYNAYYQQPYNMFQVNVVDQSGRVTNVVPIVSAPAGWGWSPCGGTANRQQVYTPGPQSVDLDLTPWANQTIKLQFSLRNFYDSDFYGECVPFDFLGIWDLPTAKAYVTNLHINSCPDAINNAVTVTANIPLPGNIDATFTPNLGLNVHDAALVCGFVTFDWVQIKTHINDPTFYSARNLGGAFDPTISGPVKLSSAYLPYHDPPQGGGYTFGSSPDFSYPFYWNWQTTELSNHQTGGLTLTFHDAPNEPCLPGGGAVDTPACNNTSEPAGSFESFTTHLVGIKSDGSYTDLGVGFDWWSDYNGTSGGVTINKTDQLADGNGTGGVTITRVQTITDYQVNETPTAADTTPPTLAVRTMPSTLWPPNGKLVTVTVSGTIQDAAGGSGVNSTGASFFVVDEYREVQPTGSVTVASDGSYSFTVQLQASRDGSDHDGRLYAITVNGQDNAGNSASATANVTVPHDQGH
ncbi:MAG TPA: hypothetical protein VHG72_15600 [Polyangia bacterium]|nr:hypothetical protein [Polyangia bacterium]